MWARARSSVEEHSPYKRGVAGSNPAVPTPRHKHQNGRSPPAPATELVRPSVDAGPATTGRTPRSRSGRRGRECRGVEELGEPVQGGRDDPVVHPGAAPFAVDQSGLAQHLEVV